MNRGIAKRTGLAVVFLASQCVAAPPVEVVSPDRRIRLQFTDGGRLGYRVDFAAKAVIEPSFAGILIDGDDLSKGVEFGRIERYRTDEAYPWYGVHSRAVDRSNGVRIPVNRSKSGITYTVEARAYNDGVAFRFMVPGEHGKRRFPDEATVFQLPAGSTVWAHDLEGHYEGIPKRCTVEEFKDGEWAAPPVTFRLANNGAYGSITEAALFHYSGMALQADGKSGFAARLGHAHPPSYPFRLRYAGDVKRMSQIAPIEGMITTPWRVILIGSNLNVLVNSDIVHNLAPPPDPKLFPRGIATEWVKPGRAVWKYLDGGENTFEEMRTFSRLAGELKFEYNVIEGFWRTWTEAQLKELVNESRRRGVGIILWKHSRELRDAASRREFFELCRRVGAAGAKIDFFDHEHKDVVELYEACLREAAEFKLVLDFHGANKPTGESRTYPNELTREAIKGMEGRRVARAPLDATLPFTRMLAGHADYTPMLFGERRADTTWAHQVASAAIYTSPLLVYGANPRSILDNPCVEVIKAIPSIWDETIALPVSGIGEIAAFARRRGEEWFVAIMNGPSAKTIQVPLSFLGRGPYKATLIRDTAGDGAAVRIEKATLKSGDSVKVEMPAGGGFVGRFIR